MDDGWTKRNEGRNDDYEGQSKANCKVLSRMRGSRKRTKEKEKRGKGRTPVYGLASIAIILIIIIMVIVKRMITHNVTYRLDSSPRILYASLIFRNFSALPPAVSG